MKGILLLILITVYVSVGMWLDFKFNSGYLTWSSPLICICWPIVLLILGIMALIDKKETNKT